ncbi:MAG TPA: hypothetical protein ENK57_12575 [Polyangiaceae bacterium]|nr:hypothetical protein [Polyangiaceae bacterium]
MPLRLAGALQMLVAIVTLCACGGETAVGHFGTNAFYPARNHYRVRYVPGEESRRALLPRVWVIDNFHVEDGRPTRARRAPRYFTSYLLDEDGDGDVTKATRTELFDLRYVHERDGSVIWARTMPLTRMMANRELSVILRDYIDRSSGGSYVEATLVGAPVVRERRLAPRILREEPSRIDGQPAYVAVVEFIDVDRHRVDPDARGEVVTLAITRPRGLVWRSRVTSGSRWPALMLLGYSARPEVHAEHEADFESFISRIDVAPPSE